MVYFQFKSHCDCWTCIYHSIYCITTVKALRMVFLKFTLLQWRLRHYIPLKLWCWLTSLSDITEKILHSFENISVSYLLVREGMGYWSCTKGHYCLVLCVFQHVHIVTEVVIFTDFSSSATGGSSRKITEESSEICVWRTLGTSTNKVLSLIFKPGWLGSWKIWI